MTLKNVTLGYDDEVVHSDISFSISEGDYVCILGANGTGKTTLIKALLGLNPPLSGRIEYGANFSSREIGYLPQQTKIQKQFPASVEEVVLSGLINRLGHSPFFSKREKEMAKENMRLLDIYSIRGRSYQELSGGQQQRVLLARALSATKSLLLLDEPVAGLDIHASSELYSLVEKLNREKNLTVLMVTHDIHPALNSANKILYLYKGGIYFGDKEAFFASEEGKIYLKESGHEHH
jgi:ABC-type Mn/Zn transport systems, ATPase component